MSSTISSGERWSKESTNTESKLLTRRLRRDRKRTSYQDYRRANEENQGFGGTKMKDVFIGQFGI